MERQDAVLDQFVRNNELFLEWKLKSWKGRLAFALSPKLRRLHAECDAARIPECKNVALARLLDALEDLLAYRAIACLKAAREDARVLFRQRGKRNRQDRSNARAKDYYSVVTIVKDEARYMREFVLFYLVTGADRLYLYDNDSTDGLVEVLQPFIDAGFVVYQKWPGRVVQTAAYRDAIRRTRRRTTWLAIVDADEFLFSPKGSTPEQLKAYEQYPGVGVNWVEYGPNGHVSMPEGLVMDNCTTTFADYDNALNHHIKSIVQPAKVLSMLHTHFPIYKGKRRAVDEAGNTLDNFPAFQPGAGKAFTRGSHRDIFRINHYAAKSLEDVEEKTQRGAADGAPDKARIEAYETILRAFEEEPLAEDYSIKPIADMVRGMCEDT